jgi:hypothetical protein
LFLQLLIDLDNLFRDGRVLGVREWDSNRAEIRDNSNQIYGILPFVKETLHGVPRLVRCHHCKLSKTALATDETFGFESRSSTVIDTAKFEAVAHQTAEENMQGHQYILRSKPDKEKKETGRGVFDSS